MRCVECAKKSKSGEIANYYEEAANMMRKVNTAGLFI